MKSNYSKWNSLLNELNSFSCKIEFLQSKMRYSITNLNSFDKQEYLKSLKIIESEHEQNLSLYSFTEEAKFIIPSKEVLSSEVFH